MVKRLNKIVAGITAAAALLFAAGCKNQLDYVDDTTALNKMRILGFYASGEGLKNFDGASAELYVVESKVAKCIAKGEVAGTNSEKLNYQSGTAYVKLDKPYLFDGDKHHTSSVEMYLVVADKSFQIWNSTYTEKNNVSLAIPTSPAGTSDSELVERFVNITLPSKDSPTDAVMYEWKASVTEPTKSNLYEIAADKLGILGSKTIKEWNDIDGVNVTTADSSSINPKYTITITGLTDDVGGKYGVRGQEISKEDKDLAGHWDQTKADEGLDATVDKDGKITFKFYGKKPSWAEEGMTGPAFKIVKVGTQKNPWECLLYLTDNTKNLYFPNDIGSKDVTLEIDYTKIADASKKFTPSAKETAKYNKQFTIKNVILKNAPAIGKAGYIAFCADWIPNNIYNFKTSNKVISLTNDTAVLEINYDYCTKASASESSKTFDFQAVNPDSDSDSKFWDVKLYENGDGWGKAVVDFSKYKDKTINLIFDAETKTASIEEVK